MPCVAGTRSFAFVVVWKERNRSTVSLYDTLRLSKPFLWHNGMKAERYKNKALCYNCLIYMSIIWYESVIDCWCTEWWSPKTCSHFEWANVAEFLFSTRLDAAPFFVIKLCSHSFELLDVSGNDSRLEGRAFRHDLFGCLTSNALCGGYAAVYFVGCVPWMIEMNFIITIFFLSRHWLTSTVRSPTQIWIHKMVSSLESGNNIRGSWYRFG